MNSLKAVALIVLGWLLGEFSSIFRSWRESRKKLNAMLYYLMELHHNFGILNLDTFTEIFIKRLCQKYPGSINEQEQETCKESIAPIMWGFIKRFIGEEFSKLKANYQQTVEDLASISPFQAFYLSGRSRILDLFDSINGLFNELGAAPTEAEGEEAIRRFKKYLEDRAYAEAQKELEKSIKGIALRISPLAYLKSLRYLDRARHKRLKEFEKEIDDYLDSLPKMFSGS